MPDILQTRAGQNLINNTLPQLVQQLQRIADALEKANKNHTPMLSCNICERAPCECPEDGPQLMSYDDDEYDDDDDEGVCVFVNGERQRN